ncbi:SAM-dependent methyltransferase [Streptomyces odontomachi]|uniref:SAM-dependent methyltransferase n=1 Tax=Streptomyces odontomachi TaxID=2944940 RepID=UPI00210EF589|nr:SAM-dependent methyltransferase [Streptomyces sp. ODS25]
MDRPPRAPRGVDVTTPSVSRMYDYYLGGSYNFQADREVARKVLTFLPGVPKAAQANRAFMRRAVEYAIGAGVTQFLDVGAGIPTFGSVHEVVRRAGGDAPRVVYVDHDPVAVAHATEVLRDVPSAGAVTGDLRKPRDILASELVGQLLDLTQPVAVLLLAVLHYLKDGDRPYEAVSELLGAMAPGSLLILTHASYEGMYVPVEQVGGAMDVYRDIHNPVIMRSRDEIARFFEGYDMVEPGLVSMPHWRPKTAVEDEAPFAFSAFAGVGRAA